MEWKLVNKKYQLFSGNTHIATVEKSRKDFQYHLSWADGEVISDTFSSLKDAFNYFR